VTICIAVKSNDQCVVTASDRRVSFDDLIPAHDNATIKTLKLGSRSLALYAGDVCSVLPVGNYADAMLRTSHDNPDWEGVENVRRVMRLAYQRARNAKIADLYLSSYGITIRQFYLDYQKGTGQFQKAFRNTKRNIDKFDLGVSFLIVGADPLGLPHIAALNNPGDIIPHDLTGMWAIGSGATLALASLTAHQYPINGLTAEAVVVPVCEAKFDAETGGGIGPDTTVVVVGPRGIWSTVDPRLITRIKNNWRRARRQRPSKEIVRLILADLETHGVKAFESLPEP